MAVRAERGSAALSPLRTVALAIGFVCAIAASVALFVTENAEYLRIGIVIALWGFVFAALAAGRRQTEQAVAASTDIEVRKGYELELEREVAARREYELRLEAQLRREVQDDFAAQVGALREEMGRLRRELSEQWDSELRVERMVMRTQSVRMGGDRREPLEHEPADRASIDAAPSDAGSSAARPFEPGPGDAASWSPSEQVEEYGPSQDVMPVGPSDEDAPTREFPAVTGDAPSMPTAPVPTPSSPSSGFPTLINQAPPRPQQVRPPTAYGAASYGAASYGAANNAAPDDVLTRVLAEAGGNPGDRRRKHRYADEDEEALPAGS